MSEIFGYMFEDYPKLLKNDPQNIVHWLVFPDEHLSCRILSSIIDSFYLLNCAFGCILLLDKVANSISTMHMSLFEIGSCRVKKYICIDLLM